MDVIRVKAFDLGEGVPEVVREVEEVASTERNDSGNSVTRRLAGAKRILVGIDHDPIFRRGFTGRGGQHRLGDDLKGRGG